MGKRKKSSSKKLKSNKTLLDRAKVTRQGKVVRTRASTAHNISKRSASARGRAKNKKIETLKDHPWNKLLQG